MIVVKYFRLFVFLCLLSSCDIFSGNSKKEQELFDKIEKGMTINEVKAILGAPDYINPSSDSGHYYYFFTENKSGMRSEMPFVKFDPTGVVEYSGY